jgi:hypothetical protein
MVWSKWPGAAGAKSQCLGKTSDWEDLVCGIVTCKVCKLMK